VSLVAAGNTKVCQQDIEFWNLCPGTPETLFGLSFFEQDIGALEIEVDYDSLMQAVHALGNGYEYVEHQPDCRWIGCREHLDPVFERAPAVLHDYVCIVVPNTIVIDLAETWLRRYPLHQRYLGIYTHDRRVSTLKLVRSIDDFDNASIWQTLPCAHSSLVYRHSLFRT